MEYIKHMKGIPACEKCGIPIRPGLFFFGEMTDPHLISQASQAIHDAQVLLLLGTTLNSEVFAHYIKYFHGKWLTILDKGIIIKQLKTQGQPTQKRRHWRQRAAFLRVG